MKTSLPRKRHRSTRTRKPSRKNDRSRRGVPPEIFVRINTDGLWVHSRFSKAHIRIRKGCFQYLVWRDGKKTCEFYLGKKANRTPQQDLAGDRGSRRRPAAAELEPWGKKKLGF
jgi:hypothetical protein